MFRTPQRNGEANGRFRVSNDLFIAHRETRSRTRMHRGPILERSSAKPVCGVIRPLTAHLN